MGYIYIYIYIQRERERERERERDRERVLEALVFELQKSEKILFSDSKNSPF